MKKSFTKLTVITAILVVIAVVVSVFSFRDGKFDPLTGITGAIVVPLQSGLSAVTDWFGGITEYFYRYDRVKAENEELKDKLADYQALEKQYYAAIDENQSLKVLARLTVENPTYEYAHCRVTALNLEGYNKTITIDKGEVNGIELFDCAAVREGVVGYVSKVGYNFAEITVITDPSVKIGVIVSQPQEVAVAEGSAEFIESGKMRLSYLSNETVAKVMDIVETSGYGDIFPAGLTIGYIDEIKPEPHGMSTYGTINTAVDFTKLKRLYVIKEV